jgi:hypothetical protein
MLHIEYEDMAADGARTAYEHGAERRALFETTPESPEILVSVERLTELAPPEG